MFLSQSRQPATHVRSFLDPALVRGAVLVASAVAVALGTVAIQGSVLAGRGGDGAHVANYIYRDDAGTRHAIERQLFWSPFVGGEGIRVSVAAGIAILDGDVVSEGQRYAAGINALEGGAVRVVNRLRVVPRIH